METANQEKIRSYISELREKGKEDLDRIITRYQLYTPEMAEAALYVAVDKGLISYALKEKLSAQISINLSGKAGIAKRLNWEKSNAFCDYVSQYDNELIYNMIDNPEDMATDVYHALLMVAIAKELISREDFDNFYKQELQGEMQEEVNPYSFYTGSHGTMSSCRKDIQDSKLPFAPGTDQETCDDSKGDISQGRNSVISLRRTGFYILASGIALSFLGYFRHWHFNGNFKPVWVYVYLGIFFAIGGLAAIIYDIAGDRKSK